jgi:c-di-GMP-related signal transduction protein
MWLIGRQPILDRDEHITAYELLFRAPGDDRANIVDPMTATATVILGALSGFGVDQVLGKHQGFVNVNEELLFDDSLELLPQESVVLELLESIRPTEAVARRCQQLRERRWRFALDDHVYAPEFEPLYPLVDVVKVDLTVSPLETIGPLVEAMRRHRFRLLAEKVETRQQFQLCHDLGFHLFQGYYFARPATMQRRRINEGAATLLKLLRLLMEDADIQKIEAAFRSSPGLTYNLLTLVNSVSFGLRQPIGSVRQAIAMLGRHHMRRWIQLALFGAHGQNALDDPLLDAAAVRATFMDQLARYHPTLSKVRDAPDEAFMVGILSLLDRLYDVAMDDLVKHLRLSENVTAALLRREGPFGELLRFVEQMEGVDVDEAPDQVRALQLTREQVLEAQWKAFAWRSVVA